MKNVYVVIGEHDGIIGVYSNIRKARSRAIAYARGNYCRAYQSITNPRSGEDILEWRNQFNESFRDENSAEIKKECVN
jgi:hypothetical protein